MHVITPLHARQFWNMIWNFTWIWWQRWMMQHLKILHSLPISQKVPWANNVRLFSFVDLFYELAVKRCKEKPFINILAFKSCYIIQNEIGKIETGWWVITAYSSAFEMLRERILIKTNSEITVHKTLKAIPPILNLGVMLLHL